MHLNQWIILLAAIVATTVLVKVRKAWIGSTLIAPWCWTLLAIGSVALSGIFTVSQPVRFAAIMTTFCPAMSLMGAKRPQDKAWNFIVLSLWAVLALPALESLVLGDGRSLDIQDARGWFLWIMIFVGLSNELLTRHCLLAILAGIGQFAMLTEYLPLVRRPIGIWNLSIGLSAIAMAMLWAKLRANRRHEFPEPLDQIWLDFRNCFGTLWGVRVMQMVNTAADNANWDIELTWFGFQKSGSSGEMPTATRRGLEQCIKNQLRRFVSVQWIEKRMPGSSQVQSKDNL